MTTKLPAYKVFYENGSSYITSMAVGVTLAMAQRYFVGQSFEQPDEKTMLRVVHVESADRPEWEPVTYGSVGGEVCRIKAWNDGTHFTLSPVSGATSFPGLLEGEFTRYNDDENEAVRMALGQKDQAGIPS